MNGRHGTVGAPELEAAAAAWYRGRAQHHFARALGALTHAVRALCAPAPPTPGWLAAWAWPPALLAATEALRFSLLNLARAELAERRAARRG